MDWSQRQCSAAFSSRAPGRWPQHIPPFNEQSVSATVSTTIDVEASPKAVWDVLVDFPAYLEWNPFMVSLEGTAEVGRRLVVHLAGRGGRGTTSGPPSSWRPRARSCGGSAGWAQGLFVGVRSFVLTAHPDGTTRLTHGERFTGILAALSRGTTANSCAGFGALNEALKRRVEAT